MTRISEFAVLPVWMLALSASLLLPNQAHAQNYTDTFEASSFNPFWTVAQQQGGTVALCTGQNHTPGGKQSACFGAQGVSGQKNLFLEHQFASPTQGDFSVWFYDSGEQYSDQTYYNFLNLTNASAGLSVGVGTMDFDPSCYAAAFGTPTAYYGPNASCGPYPQTSTTDVQRTVGWHKFEINVTASSLSILIDGNQVLDVPGSYSFTTLALDLFGPESTSSTTYFDDFVETTSLVAPRLTKAFGGTTITAGGTASLTFDLTNPNPSGATLTGLAFGDTLPSSVVVATPNGLTGSCGGGTITATAGSNSISLSGASLAGGASCTFSVSVTTPLAFSSLGLKTNTTSTVGSNEAPAGSAASASVIVTADPYLSSSWWYWYVL